MPDEEDLAGKKGKKVTAKPKKEKIKDVKTNDITLSLKYLFDTLAEYNQFEYSFLEEDFAREGDIITATINKSDTAKKYFAYFNVLLIVPLLLEKWKFIKKNKGTKKNITPLTGGGDIVNR